MEFGAALKRLCNVKAKVSAHYLVVKNGEVYELVGPEHTAWHAGESSWDGEKQLNESSIGIELDSYGNEAFTDRQMLSLMVLCRHLVEEYNIPQKNIVGHSDVAPDRKIDPGIFFDWQRLSNRDLGIWHNLDVPENSPILFSYGDKSDKIKTIQQKLHKLGYKIESSGEFDRQTNNVIRAFQSRYYPSIIKEKGLRYYKDLNSTYNWDEFSEAILEKLLSFYL